MARRYREIRAAMPFAVPHYAVKACPEPAVIHLLAESAPGSAVFCRLLAGSEGARWPLGDKFGCSPEFAVDLLQTAAKLDLNPHGLSFHVGSQQTDPSRW